MAKIQNVYTPIEFSSPDLEGLSRIVHRELRSLADMLNNQAVDVSADWDSIVGKPLTFPPAVHSHGNAEITDLAWGKLTGLPDFATRWPTWSEVTSKPSTFAPSAHGHAWNDLSSIPATASRWPAWSEVTSKPATFAPSAHTHPWAEVTGKPTTFTPSAHTHGDADITALAWSKLTGVPATFAPTAHTHAWADITGEPVYATRWPTWSEVTSKPVTFPPDTHTHSAADVTSGTFADARIAASNVTQHQAALSIAWSQVTSVPSYQPLDADLTAIGALAGTSGLLRKTAANTWSLDTSTYLTSFTETDPTVPAGVKAITGTQITNWDTAFGWGNHASAGYLTSVAWSDLTGIPSFASRWPAWSEVTSKPATFTPSAHTHDYFSNTTNAWSNDSEGNPRLYFGNAGNATNGVVLRGSNADHDLQFRNSDNTIVFRVGPTGQVTAGTVPWARLTAVPAGATYDGSDAVKLTGDQTIAGSKRFSSSSDTTPLRVSRNTSSSEELTIGVDDTSARITYTNDESVSALRFRFINTDTETEGGANASDWEVAFAAGPSGVNLSIPGSLSFTGTLTGGTVPWARLSDIPATFAPSAHTHDFNDVVLNHPDYRVAPQTGSIYNGDWDALTESSGFYLRMTNTGWTNRPPTGTYYYPQVLKYSNNVTQIAWPYRVDYDGLHLRNKLGGVWNPWRRVWMDGYAPWSGITSKPSTFTPSAHTHTGNDVTTQVSLLNSSTTLSSSTDHNRIIYNTTSGITFTLSNTPEVGVQWQIHNRSAGNITIATGGNTVYWMDGGGAAPATGNRTLARSGVATVVKIASAVFHIYGAGLS